MDTLKIMYLKYKTELLYLFFGGCTTLVNIVCYYALYHQAHMGNVTSTVAAWVASVLFAYITNRQFVFVSKAEALGELCYEISTFFGCRLATGIMDTVIMVVTVDYMHWNSLLWKVLSNVLVVLINYIAGKFFIFKDK